MGYSSPLVPKRNPATILFLSHQDPGGKPWAFVVERPQGCLLAKMAIIVAQADSLYVLQSPSETPRSHFACEANSTFSFVSSSFCRLFLSKKDEIAITLSCIRLLGSSVFVRTEIQSRKRSSGIGPLASNLSQTTEGTQTPSNMSGYFHGIPENGWWDCLILPEYQQRHGSAVNAVEIS